MFLNLRMTEANYDPDNPDSWVYKAMMSLVFKQGGKGTWRILDTEWICMLAYDVKGEFTYTKKDSDHSDMATVRCFDGHSDEPAFVLLQGPNGESFKHPYGGYLVEVENPRNPYGKSLDVEWSQDVLMETEL
jgi:hypothetical protein